MSEAKKPTDAGNDEMAPAAVGAGQMNPGDEAPPGAPGAAENICPVCHGSGKLAGNRACGNCGGTGRVIQVVSAGP